MMLTDRLYVGAMKISKRGCDHMHGSVGFVLYATKWRSRVLCGAVVALGRCGPIIDVFWYGAER